MFKPKTSVDNLFKTINCVSCFGHTMSLFQQFFEEL